MQERLAGGGAASLDVLWVVSEAVLPRSFPGHERSPTDWTQAIAFEPTFGIRNVRGSTGFPILRHYHRSAFVTGKQVGKLNVWHYGGPETPHYRNCRRLEDGFVTTHANGIFPRMGHAEGCRLVYFLTVSSARHLARRSPKGGFNEIGIPSDEYCIRGYSPVDVGGRGFAQQHSYPYSRASTGFRRDDAGE
ncbi:hypothetical protein GOB57_10070 [Sinorhizobium meliloti]|nr:hypothetical protein [Sinorhizobium meliloti]